MTFHWPATSFTQFSARFLGMRIVTTSDEDIEEGNADPSSIYPTPEALVQDPSRERDVKKLLLKQWALDLDLKLTADSEGMSPASEVQRTRDTDMLRRVGRCLTNLTQEKLSH